MASDTTAPPQLGNYDIVSKIADGGMGTVFKAKHRTTGEVVAIKVIAPTTTKNPILLKRFKQEFDAAKQLDHPNVVRAIDFCGTGPNPFLVMEYVDGESFGQRIERQGKFPEAEAVRLISQVCEGLQRAHKQGLVHRDVKPDNILVNKDGVAKLTDMGLVKDVEGDLNLTKTGRGLGTPHFMAPEQFRNAKTVDVRGDIYALGATLYAMVTGVVPFENASPLDCWMKKIRNEFPPPKELNPALSDRVDWAIRRAMSAEPDRRPSSCREFLEDLTGQSRVTPTRAGSPPAPAAAAAAWYMVYKDEAGTTHTVKGSTEGIRNALQNQLLGDAAAIVVSRTKTGQFSPLTNVPEFRDLVVNPAPLPQSGAPRPTDISAGLAKASGVVPQTTRRPADADAVDPGATPSRAGTSGSASQRGRGPSPGSARHMALPPEAKQTPATPGQTKRMPAQVPLPLPPSDSGEPPFADPFSTGEPVDPHADTELYVPTIPGTAPQEPVPDEPPREEREKNAAPFDWTPILVVLVLILSAMVGYLLLDR